MALRASAIVVLVAGLVSTASAQASFPGRNGLLASGNLDVPYGKLVSISPRDDRARTLSPLTGTRLKGRPTPSPDGRLIALQRATINLQDGGALLVVRPDGSGERVLAKQAYSALPSWSPTGRRLAFTRLVGADQNSLSWLDVIRANGKGRRDLVQNGRHPIWSPDGRLIAFTRYDDTTGGTNVFVVRPDGKGLREIGQLDGFPDANREWFAWAAWSPDGRWLVYGKQGQLAVVAVSGGKESRLLPAGSIFGVPVGISWSPDGTMIAFTASYETEGPIVFTVPATGGVPRDLASGAPEDDLTSTEWSPDGSTILATSYERVAAIDARTGGLDALYRGSPAWSVGGAAWVSGRKVLVSSATGESEIVVRKRAWGAGRQLTRTPWNESEPAWSPDGRRLAFRRYGPAAQGLAVSDARGRHERQLTTDASDRAPTWSPDGKRILFVRNGDSLAEVGAQSGNVSILYQYGDGIVQAKWSPRGRRIAFVDTRGSLYLLDPADRRLTLLTATWGYLPDVVRDLAFDWSPDGRRLAVLRETCPDAGCTSNLKFVTAIPLGGGRGHVILSGTCPYRNQYWDVVQPAWSPDGRHIVCGGDWQPLPHKGRS